MADRLTRERVIDAAVTIVESDGLDGLSMRALCEKLGVSVTSIYWHVGNKDALLDALVERTQAAVVAVEPRGATPRQRLRSIALSMLSAIEEHRELIGIAHRRGAVAYVFAPARRAVAIEFHAAGLRGVPLVDATNALLQFVVGFSLTESIVARTPSGERHPLELWEGAAPIDDVAARRLALEPDLRRAFEVSLDAFIVGLLAL
jgi:AcrR family transcriptional regulator